MTILAPLQQLNNPALTEPTSMHSWAVVIAQALEHAGEIAAVLLFGAMIYFVLTA